MVNFKDFFRKASVFIIDDIQFMSGKESLQEEFFHTFNSLMDKGSQIIISSDRAPMKLDRVQDRIKSRLAGGLVVDISVPDLELKIKIIKKKIEEIQNQFKESINLSEEVITYVASESKSNVRELEGALKRVAANAKFAKTNIDINLIKDSLRDVLAIQAKMVTISNIQRVVADYFNIKMSDLLSKRRNRSITRPRQVAMALSKELTNHSLPEIGEAFGGRDHTTVIHACEKTKELIQTSLEIEEDYKKLRRTLSA